MTNPLDEIIEAMAVWCEAGRLRGDLYHVIPSEHLADWTAHLRALRDASVRGKALEHGRGEWSVICPGDSIGMPALLIPLPEEPKP